MKRLLTLAAVFLCCMSTTFAQFSGSGSGTENDPYLILNPIQLSQMRNYLNQSGVYFKLMSNIDVSEFIEDEWSSQGWMPIGTSSIPFKGVLDGNGKSISGFWINRPSTDYVGLFANTYGATIKNITINASSVKGKSKVGIISGYTAITSFSGCIVSLNDLTGSGESVGGIVGCVNGGSISECQVVCNNITGENIVGGIYGDNNSSITPITACHVQGNVNGGDCVGGIAGKGCDITNTNFCGNVTGNNKVGGICGYNYYKFPNGVIYDGTIIGCYAVSHVVAAGNQVGGLIGEKTSGLLCDSYFSGTVSGNEQVGGLVGHLKGSTIKKNYANTIISGAKSIGGLIGNVEGYNKYNNAFINSNVTICSSIKAIVGNVGRIYGEGSGVTIGEIGTTTENKAWNRAIIVSAGVAQDVTDNEQNGTGVSATTLKLKATYVGMDWDFTDTWTIQETECFPYMKSQTAPAVITSQVVSGATTISGKCVDGGTVTLEIDGVKQEKVSSGHNFSFMVSPLQAGHEVRISAKAEGKEMSYYTTETVSYLGKGTETDPYQVYTAADLTGVYRRGYFKLMNDIDLSDYINQFSPNEGWQSIGREGSETIHFDGNGHKITGLWCNSTRDNTGLFSCFANGTIKNLTVTTAKNKQVKGGANTGIIIGKMMNGTIENCSVEGTVADGTPVGGMVGLFDGGTISKCQANVTINTTLATSYVGGLVGETTGGTIDQCFTEGTLTGTGSESYIGGLIGKNQGTLTNSYSTAVINSSYNAAGVVAYNYGLVDKCYAVGNLFSNNYAAGVIGYNDGADAVVSNCAVMINKLEVVYESQQQQQGGGYGQRIIGGLKNGAPAPEMNNYALKTMQVSLNDVPQTVYDDIMNGTGKTAAELTTKATYQELDWDFTNIWKIADGTGYPYQTGITPITPDDPNPDDPDPIVNPDTDISSMNNVIYLNKVEASADSQINLSIRMKNTAAIRGFQFDIYLPEGVTVVKSAKGKIVGSLSDGRLPEDDEHSLTLSEQGDGAIRFLCGSLYDETFTGNDGEIATLSVKIGKEMNDGDYPIILRNMKLTETDINNYYQTDYVKSTLIIKSYTLGDINNDQKIDVSDYIGIANHILGNTPEGFVAKAADVNEDGLIDVSDYIGVANLIHSGSIFGKARRKAMGMDNTNATDISSLDNIIYVASDKVKVGEKGQLSICMKNSALIRGYQFSLNLPEGVTPEVNSKGRIVASMNKERLDSEDEHTLTTSLQEDGSILFLCGSLYDESYQKGDGEIITLNVNVDQNTIAGDYPVVVKNSKLTETDISKYYETETVESVLTIETTSTGIQSFGMMSREKESCFNLNGQKVQHLKKGVYVIKGKKFVVK